MADKRRSGAGAARKRSCATHEQQVVADWLGDTDQGHDTAAPTALLAGIAPADLYEDPYDAEPGKDVSFDGLPAAMKRSMMDALAKVAPAIRMRTITAERDPTAIVLPANHRHDVVFVPESARRAVADGDALAAVVPAHRAHLTGLPDYDNIELTFAQLNLAPPTTQRAADLHVSVQDLVDEVDSGYAHSVHVPGGGDPHVFVVFDVDYRNTFFCAVALRRRHHLITAVEECTAWSVVEQARLGKLAGAFMGRAYFQCPCVRSTEGEEDSG
jgi:hypothetical protein